LGRSAENSARKNEKSLFFSRADFRAAPQPTERLEEANRSTAILKLNARGKNVEGKNVEGKERKK